MKSFSFVMTMSALILSPAISAQEFPNRPITLIVGFEAGGGSDFIARTLAKTLGDKLGKPVVVENRPGSGGVLATRSVTREKADGYTLLLGSAAAFVINPFMMKNIGYNPIADFTPIASVARFNYVLLGRKTLPVNSLAELVEYAKSNPGKLNIGSAGVGSNTHLVAVSFMNKAGIKMTHVPYKGTAGALNDLLGGNIDLLFDSVPTTITHVKSRKLKAFATTGSQREDEHPDIPVLAQSSIEGLKQFQASNWFAVFAPKGVDADITTVLNNAINASLKDPELLKRFRQSGNSPLPGSPKDLSSLVQTESKTYETLIKSTGIAIH